MKVLGVNPIGLSISIFGWTHIAIHDNVVWVLGVSTIVMVISIFGWLFNRRQDQLSRVAHAVSREKDDERRSCFEGDTLQRSSEAMKTGPILEPKHKIFLSHSGAQKEFVEHLCKALEDCLYYPFFDRRHESLPKGEQFPELIVQAAKQCEMLIVVVSDEYFMSKWPMIELSTFVRAHKLHRESKNSTNGPKILPLFYGLSVHDLEDASKRKKWFRKWEALAKADPKKRIQVCDWKYALDVLGSFNGIVYDANLKEIVSYEEKIVSNVCKSIAPDVKWDDSHVQGKSSIHKVIDEKIKGIEVSRKYKVKVVGIFGVGGVGKTTTCKTMCNEMSSKYEGRVCHLEFPSVPSSVPKELFQQVLKDLTRKNIEVIQHLNEGQCKNILQKSLFHQKNFLAIDNITDHYQSIQQAKMFLKVPYHKDSLVVVTARSQRILELLGIDGDACFEIPDLEERDAMNLFLHHAANGKKNYDDEEKHNILTCVRRCYFSKGNRKDHHYHPLALQALGLQLGCHGDNPHDWVKNLPQLKTFNYFFGENPVFDILRSSFDTLSLRDKTLFMDLGCFTFLEFGPLQLDIEWLCDAFQQNEEELTRQLEHLKRKGLLLDVDLRSQRFSMHDLYLEFAKLEANGSFNESTNLRKRMWAYVENGGLTKLESIPKGGCWHKLIRLAIIQSSLAFKRHGRIVGGVGGMEGIKWGFFSNVEVLQLSGLHWGHGALNLEGLMCLRILELYDVSELDRVEGLDKLKHLTFFDWVSYEPHSSDGVGVHIVGQLPSSLRRFYISGADVVLKSDVLAHCYNLSKLQLHLVEAYTLDLSNCKSLDSVSLDCIRNLQTVSGVAIGQPSNLQSLVVIDCEDVVDVPGIGHLMGLKKLHVDELLKGAVPNLLMLTKLQDLSFSSKQNGLVHANDCIPHQLQELRWHMSQSKEGISLSGFIHLEVLDLSWSVELTSLIELGDLPTLRCLNLGFCKHLMRLPNLGMSKNLKELQLNGCSSLELYENDIQMLSKLPLLQPVPFSERGEDEKFRLDLTREKMLIYTCSDCAPILWELWKEDEWEERDLGTPPIKIGHRGTWK